jgi:hypothetical protein
MMRKKLKMFVMCQCFVLAFCSCENKDDESYVDGADVAINKVNTQYNAYDETKDLLDTELIDYITAKSKEYGVNISSVAEEYQGELDSLLNMCLLERIENDMFTNETIGLLQGYLTQMEAAISNNDTIKMEEVYLHIYNVLNCTEYVSIRDITLDGDDEFAVRTDFIREIFQEVEKSYPNFQKLSYEQKEDVFYLASVYSQIKLNNSKAAPVSNCERCMINYNRAKSRANAIAVVGISACAAFGPVFATCSAVVLAELAVELAFILSDYKDCVEVNC